MLVFKILHGATCLYMAMFWRYQIVWQQLYLSLMSWALCGLVVLCVVTISLPLHRPGEWWHLCKYVSMIFSAWKAILCNVTRKLSQLLWPLLPKQTSLLYRGCLLESLVPPIPLGFKPRRPSALFFYFDKLGAANWELIYLFTRAFCQWIFQHCSFPDSKLI